VAQAPVDEQRCDRIGETLDQASDLVIRYLSDRTGLTLAASFVLNRLHREGPSRLTILATKEGVSQPAMTQLIQRMERHGLVTRMTDPEDGRVALVGLTDAGIAVLDDRRQVRRERLTDLLTTLTADEARALALAAEVALPIMRRLTWNADLDLQVD
jgi:DNA-binding MarR family transcriptional regulator